MDLAIGEDVAWHDVDPRCRRIELIRGFVAACTDLRWRYLKDAAFAHDRHTVRHGHGFRPIVRDVDERHAQLVVKLPDLARSAWRRLASRLERLVEQEHGGVANHRARARATRWRYARQVRRLTIE